MSRNESESIPALMVQRDYRRVLPLIEQELERSSSNNRLRLQYADALAGVGRAADAVAQYEATAGAYEAAGLVVQAIAVRKKAEKLSSSLPSEPRQSRPLPEGPFFEVLSAEEREAVADRLQLEEYEEGDLVITEGDRGTSMYVIAAGDVNVYTTGRGGKTVHLARLGPGDFFGEVSVLSGKPRTATISACGKTTLLRLDRDQLEQIVEHFPRVRQVLEEFCRRRAEKTVEAMIETLRNRSE